MQIKKKVVLKRGDFVEIRRTLSSFTFLLIKNGIIIERFEVPEEPCK